MWLNFRKQTTQYGQIWMNLKQIKLILEAMLTLLCHVNKLYSFQNGLLVTCHLFPGIYYQMVGKIQKIFLDSSDGTKVISCIFIFSSSAGFTKSGSSFLKLVLTKNKWNAAKEACENMVVGSFRARLAVIKSQTKQNEVENYLRQTGVGSKNSNLILNIYLQVQLAVWFSSVCSSLALRSVSSSL